MPKTPEQIYDLRRGDPERERWLLDNAVPIGDIEKFIHLTAHDEYGSPAITERIFQLSTIALNVRISDQAAKSAEKLSGQTARLIDLTASLIVVAEEQKELAAKLEAQTNKLIRLTWGLVGFSVALLAVAMIQTKIMLKENSEAHIQHIEAGQTNQQPATNKQVSVPHS